MAEGSISKRFASAVQTCSFHLVIPSDVDWIPETVQYLASKAVEFGVCAGGQELRVEVALHEALTNSIVHGNLDVPSKLKEGNGDAFAELLAERLNDLRYVTREVAIDFHYDGSRMLYALTDAGKGFDVEKALAPVEPMFDEDGDPILLPSGRGILMMRAMFDDVRYECGGRRVVMELRKPGCGERRQSPRVSFHQPLTVFPIDGNGTPLSVTPYEAVSRDLSKEGMSLIQRGETRLDRVAVQVSTSDGTVMLPAEVCRWQPLEDGLVQVGCRFLLPEKPEKSEDKPTPPSGSEAMHPPLIQLLKGMGADRLPPQERRAHPRVPYTGRINVTLIGSHESSASGSIHAFGRDLSLGGIAFISRIPFPMANVEVSLPNVKGEPIVMTARIVRSRELVNGFFDVAARFYSPGNSK